MVADHQIPTWNMFDMSISNGPMQEYLSFDPRCSAIWGILSLGRNGPEDSQHPRSMPKWLGYKFYGFYPKSIQHWYPNISHNSSKSVSRNTAFRTSLEKGADDVPFWNGIGYKLYWSSETFLGKTLENVGRTLLQRQGQVTRAGDADVGCEIWKERHGWLRPSRQGPGIWGRLRLR